MISSGQNFRPGWSHLHFSKFTVATAGGWAEGMEAGDGEAIRVIQVRNHQKGNDCIVIETRGQYSRQLNGNVSNK